MAHQSKEHRARYERARKVMAKHGPDLLAKIEGGTPLSLALAALQLPPSVEDDLAGRPDVRAALARRAEHLRAQLADPDKAKREQAAYLLEVDHGVRRPGTTLIGDRLAVLLAKFRDWCTGHDRADAFNELRRILLDAGEIK